MREMIGFAAEKGKEKEIEEATESWDMTLIEVLVDLVEKSDWYKFADIRNELNNRLEDFEINARTLSKMLTNLGFTKKKKSCGRKEYFIDKDKLEWVAKKFGIVSLPKGYVEFLTEALTEPLALIEIEMSYCGTYNKDVTDDELNELHATLEKLVEQGNIKKFEKGGRWYYELVKAPDMPKEIKPKGSLQEQFRNMLEQLSKDFGQFTLEELKSRAKEVQFPEEKIESILTEYKRRGEIFEPKTGVFQVIEC